MKPSVALMIVAIACGHQEPIHEPIVAPAHAAPRALRPELRDSDPCQDAPKNANRGPTASATGRDGSIVVDLHGVSRSCRAEFLVTAFVRDDLVTLDLRARELLDPPDGCLCFRDLTIRVPELGPGRYRVVSRYDLRVDAIVR
jgi:hypothetical protein